MRTLPIKARELALLRWWERIGAPLPFIALGIVMAWFSNRGSGLPVPPFESLWMPVAASLATLGFLSVLPLPTLSAGRGNLPVFAVVWLALVIGGIYGVPLDLLHGLLPLGLLVCGSILALISLGLARSGRVLQAPPLARVFAGFSAQEREASDARWHFSGWSVLVIQWMGSLLLMAFASVVVVSIVRPHVHVLQQALPWVFVSITGAVGTMVARRWLCSVRALLCLPIRRSTLALIVCLALMAPVVVSSALATAVNMVVPEWGIAIPLYMLPVFAIVPALEMSWHRPQATQAVPNAVQQWSPIMQLVAWPLWTGSFMSLELTRLLPGWFDILAISAAAVLAVVAYLVVLGRLRAGAALGGFGEPVTPV
jgi:hypothetical protein